MFRKVVISSDIFEQIKSIFNLIIDFQEKNNTNMKFLKFFNTIFFPTKSLKDCHLKKSSFNELKNLSSSLPIREGFLGNIIFFKSMKSV